METQRFKQLKLRTFLFSIVFLMLGNLPLFSQVDFSKADSIAANFSKSVDDVEDLAFQLTTSLETDIEKARVFYMWLANNVRYDCKKFHKRENPEFTAHSKEAAAKKYAVWKKEQIEKTIKRKKGICEDYSQTFKALCDAVKIEAEVVSGDSRNFHRPYKNKQNNSHAWNAVKIDDQWYLLDATWAAGYTDAAVKN